MLAKYGAASQYGKDIPIAVIGIESKVFTVVINIDETVCPITVAQAAPDIPHLQAKMKIGSRAIFTIIRLKRVFLCFSVHRKTA